MSRRAILALQRFGEVNLFLRGIIPLVGFHSSKVFYERSKRVAGYSKYPFRKMVRFAFEGISSFSTVPLQLITVMGFVIFFTSCFVGFWACIAKLRGQVVLGWVSTFAITAFLGGIQMFSLGIIGAYIGKIYGETKKRPRYLIESYSSSSKQTEISLSHSSAK